LNGLLDLYRQQFRTTLAIQLQYRASLVIWLIGQVLGPLVTLSVWTAVSRSAAGAAGGYGPSDFAAYYIVLMLVNHLTFTWIMYEMEYRVRHGSMSLALLRPVHPIHEDLADNVSYKLLTLPLLLIAAAVLALGFRPSFSVTAWSAAAFLPALFLAFLLRFLMEWTLALAAFWTTRVTAVNQIYFVVTLFLSGQIAPLALMPRAVRTAGMVLPFRWTVGFPVELLLGRLSFLQALEGIGAQLAWIGLCLLILRAVWRAGVRAYGAVGA
jgi:ABC-2 type transport system permease protein